MSSSLHAVHLQLYLNCMNRQSVTFLVPSVGLLFCGFFIFLFVPPLLENQSFFLCILRP